MRFLYVALAAVLVLTVSAPEALAKFRYTHKVTISGEATDNWTTTNPASCAANGSGSLTVKFNSVGVTRIRPQIMPNAARHRSKKLGSWVLGVPAGGGVGHMRSRRAQGTITTVDNTVQNPSEYGPQDVCEPTDKSGCGVAPLKDAMAQAAGYDARHIYGALAVGGSFEYMTKCKIAAFESWNWPFAIVGGDNTFGEMVLTMPTPATLRRKKVVTITRTIRKTSSSKRSQEGTEVYTDDVTRTLTVSFTRL